MRPAHTATHVAALTAFLGLITLPVGAAGIAAADPGDPSPSTASEPAGPKARPARIPGPPAAPRGDRKRTKAAARAEPPGPARASAARIPVTDMPRAEASRRIITPPAPASAAAGRPSVAQFAQTIGWAAPPRPAAPAAVMGAATVSGLAGAPNPLADNGTGLPLVAPVSWAVAAAARREWGVGSGGPAPAAARLALFNRPPVITSVVVGAADPASGVVTATVTARDPNNDRMTFRVSSTAKGRAGITAGGVLTYTPTAAAMHAAARESAPAQDSSDSVTVTVADTRLARVSRAVTVPIVARNAAPVASATVGSPNAATGEVNGRVSATDADGDTLTYSAPASTAKGTLTIDPGSGVFAYRPSAAARDAAAAPGAGDADRQDGFTMTVADGYGGRTSVAVSVPVSPTASTVNRAPTGTVTVNTPDPVSGAVTGVVIGRDADLDVLSYSAPALTAKGRVTVDATTGSFSYAPTSAARDAAAAPGATDNDRRDGFTVIVADGRGGSAAVAVSVQIAPTPAAPTNLPAFPGAEGFGAYATGGRGGSVVYVTNLNADGPGSLQWAIDQPGAKYILFKVSGVINTQIHLTNGNVTIAGQTSPGGITIRGFVTDESPYQDQDVRAPSDFAENWILQHVRLRPGTDPYSDDGLRLRYTRNAIVDHVSIGNATDEAIEISYSNNITVQNTLLAETLGYHAQYGGILMNYSNPAYGFGLDNVSLHHNVFNRIWGRLPEGSRESLAAANSTMNLEMSNNLYWDPRFFVALGPSTGVVTNGAGNPYPIYWKINAVNNYFRTGSSFPYGMFDDQILRNPANQLYVSGNKMSLYPTRSDYELFYCCNDYAALSNSDVASLVSQQQAQKRTTRFPFPTITYTPTDQLRTLLLGTAGAWPRDPMDTRLMQNVAANSISAAPIDSNPAGDALRLPFTGTAPAAPADTDNDGMPDAWEIARGLNPAVPNTNATTLSSLGYTDLEVYLQELSASRINGSAL